MSFLSLSDYGAFLNTHLGVQCLLAKNHDKMQVLLSAMGAKVYGTEIVIDAYLNKLENTLTNIQSPMQKEWHYWLNHRTCLECLAASETRVGYSNYRLMLNSQEQLYTFLEQNYLRIQILLAVMSSHGVCPEQSEVEVGLEIFSKYLSINHSLNAKVLKIVKKTIALWEALCSKDRSMVDVSGSAQFQNLITYCNRWGSEG